MGRVSKHKRIKACDPFYKGPRRVDRRIEDLPPDAPDDQPMPKTLIRLLKSGQQITALPSKPLGKEKHSSSNDSLQKRGSKGERIGKIAAKSHGGGDFSRSGMDPISLSGGDWQKRDHDSPMFKRQRGESLKAYLERIDTESNARIMEAYRKSRGNSERRKRYFEKRRKKQKGIQGEKELNAASKIVEFHDLKDQVLFGEVTHAPPRLNAKPRGSTEVTRKGKSLLLHGKLKPSTETKSKTETPAPKVGGLKRQRDIEMEREKAIQQYRLVKKARTNNSSLR